MVWDPEDFEPKYLVALDEIFHAGWVAGKKRGMARLRRAVEHFWPAGHPARLIHVTGTNGKGSVCHYLAQGLRCAGVTGSWTGPHLFDYAERFHINGERVDHKEIAAIYHDILEPYQRTLIERGDTELSFAGLGILLALHLFQRHHVTWGIMEEGSGGRYTPLMALDMAACILTDVGDDHPETLGRHFWQRALEKAGSARPGIPFFTAAGEPARPFVVKAAAAEGAPVTTVAPTDIAAIAHLLANPQPSFKLRNLALACKVIGHFYPETELADLKDQMTAHLPARFWSPEARIVVDMAHNPDKIAGLAEALRLAFPGMALRLVIGLTRNRDAPTVFAPLLAEAVAVTVTSAAHAGQDPQAVAERLRPLFAAVEVEPDPRAAYQAQRDQLAPNQVLVLTGSSYMIDLALNPNPYLQYINASYGWRLSSS